MLKYNEKSVTTRFQDQGAMIAGGATAKQPEVVDAMEDVGRTIARITDITQGLRERLSPVLRSMGTECGKPVRPSLDSPLANAIRRQDDELQAIEDALRDLTVRLEI